MPKKHKQPMDERQLSLFDMPENTPPLAQPIIRQKEMSAEEIIQAKEKFSALGKHFGYPHIEYADPRMEVAWMDIPEVEIVQGLDAWTKCLEQQTGDWVIAFTKWLDAGVFYDASFIHKIRKGREEMLVHYAMLKRYPEQQIGDLLVGTGEQAWKSAARALDGSTLENAIHQLAEGDLLDE